MAIQNWTRLYSYIEEYQNLLYEYYSKHAVAFLTTYWNINKDVTVWDDKNLFGGSYERVGDLTGMRWDKYLVLPVYFPEEISVSFDGQETGQIKDQETTIVIPSSYGVTPLVGDVVKLDQQFLRPYLNTYPIFIVTGVDIHPNTDRRFWRLKIKVFESRTVDEMELQTEDTYVFFDYDKQIHTLQESLDLAEMLAKNEELNQRLRNMWDPNIGFYMV